MFTKSSLGIHTWYRTMQIKTQVIPAPAKNLNQNTWRCQIVYFFFRTSKMSWQARWHCKVRLKSIQSCLSLGKIRFTIILKYKWRKLSISVLCCQKNPPIFYPLALFFNLQNSVHTHQKCELRWRARWSNWEDLKVSQHFIRIMMAAIFFWKRRDLLHVGKKKKKSLKLFSVVGSI